MGSPEDEWFRGRTTENQIAVILTHRMEVQREELTRGEWTAITGLPAPGPEACTEGECPVAMVSWWDAVHAANLLSEQKGLEPCYEPVGCSGALAQDLACTGVAEPEKSVYECEGYRLPTRAEAEYAARAGTISTFYSGNITSYDNTSCNVDPAVEAIGWYCFNSGNRPHAGGELQANRFGLFDMIGNLLEWTNEEDHSQSSPGGENPRGRVGSNPRRMFFNGQYDGQAITARTAGLLGGSWNARGNQGGFRLVRSLPAP
jgi:formylglycine-generating enzyme